eukprot:6208677-Pleurochrysis_carterae.AAC.7
MFGVKNRGARVRTCGRRRPVLLPEPAFLFPWCACSCLHSGNIACECKSYGTKLQYKAAAVVILFASSLRFPFLWFSSLLSDISYFFHIRRCSSVSLAAPPCLLQWHLCYGHTLDRVTCYAGATYLSALFALVY